MIDNIASIAANIRGGPNPEYTADDFLEFYPQFGSVPALVIDEYVRMAHESVLESRWHSKWRIAIGLYIAHHLTVWSMTASDQPQTPGELVSNAETSGSISSKSVDGVSVSYGQSASDSDMQGWGMMGETLYGKQFVTMAKLIGRGPMYVM